MLSETLDDTGRQLQEAVNNSRTTVVSIGVELARTTVLRVNDEVGILQAFAHLLKRHDCKSIAFIAGPERSRDGQRRLDSYRSALQDFGLPYDPTLIARGDYEARSGYEAVHTLRQRKNRGFDAILAANDLMAIGAIDGLKAQGISVPEHGQDSGLRRHRRGRVRRARAHDGEAAYLRAGHGRGRSGREAARARVAAGRDAQDHRARHPQLVRVQQDRLAP